MKELTSIDSLLEVKPPRGIFGVFQRLAAHARIIWRLSSGRWFIFREEDTWLVLEWATWESHQGGTPYDELHPLMRQGIEQANEELRLRLLRRLQLDPNVIVDAETYNLLNKS